MKQPLRSSIVSACLSSGAAALAVATALTLLIGSAPDARSAAAASPLVGKAAPDFELPTLAGDKKVRLSSLAGKVVFVDFWATWCEPCKKELPALQRLHDTLSSAGAVIIAISVDEDPAEARLWSTKRKLTMPLLSDTKGVVADKYKLAKMPTSVVIDKAGVVRFVNAGFEAGDEKAFEDQLRKLLAP